MRNNRTTTNSLAAFCVSLLLLFTAAACSDSPPKPPDGMALVPGGKFMASEVIAGEVDQFKEMSVPAFFMDKYEVTQKVYEEATGKNPSDFKGPDHPVEMVNWHEAQAYCAKLGKRLPTEWEWEKAARTGTTTKYFWGEEADPAYASFDGVWNDGHFPIGQRQPNAYGLYDTSGNVWEWTTTDEGGAKVLRGGSWFSSAHWVRSAVRITNPPGRQNPDMGFRCAASVAPKP